MTLPKPENTDFDETGDMHMKKAIVKLRLMLLAYGNISMVEIGKRKHIDMYLMTNSVSINICYHGGWFRRIIKIPIWHTHTDIVLIYNDLIKSMNTILENEHESS